MYRTNVGRDSKYRYFLQTTAQSSYPTPTPKPPNFVRANICYMLRCTVLRSSPQPSTVLANYRYILIRLNSIASKNHQKIYCSSSSMFYFTRVVPIGWAFLQGTLGIFWCGIQIQGETEPDDIQLEACSTCLPPKKKWRSYHNG